MIDKELHFPDGFLWGTGSSSHQVEGNNVNNDWWEFEQNAKKIKNGDVSGKSINQYELFDGDFAMCEKWGHNTHRFSIEWSRLFPEEGVVNQKEVDHYKKVFESLLAHNLIPFPTLFHFCVPLWFRKLGGFEKKENLDHWKRYVELVAKEFLPFAKKWFTINEPGANTFGSYLTGDSPPNKINPPLAYIVYENIMRAHGSAYHILKNAGAEEVDIVKSVVPTYPANPDDERDVKQANFSWNFYTGVVTRALREGVFAFPESTHHKPVEIPELKGSSDVFSITYYQRAIVSHKNPLKLEIATSDDEVVSQMGQGCYPKGIHECLHRCAKELPGMPLMVSENGICAKQDIDRIKFLEGHISEVHHAISDGLDVRGYLYWTLIDNFEWTQGWEPKFGLVGCDRETFERQPRPSAEMFSEIAKANAITPKIVNRYLKD